MRGRLAQLVLPPLVIAVVAGTVGCSGSKAESTGDKADGVPVTAAAVEQKDAPVEIRGIGTVQAYATVSVKPQVGGQIAAVHFTEGQEVKTGEPLFTIDPRPFEAELRQAEANLARDRAQAEHAAIDLGRLASLFAEQVVSQEERDRAKERRDSLEASVKANLAAVENAKLRLQYCSIASPIAGRLGQILVHAGNVVKENESPLAVINQTRPVYVTFSVPQQDLPEIRRRMADGKLTVRAGASGDTTRSPVGDLSFVDNAVDPTTGTVTLKALFPNPEESLWPGEFTNVVLTLSIAEGAIVAPRRAILTGQQGSYAFVIKPDDTVESRAVVVARQVGEEAVIEKGLSPGERVVTDGQIRLAPGVRVRVKEAGAAASEAPRAPSA
jgi:membrane fusion protein, multidrug efflux system